MEKKNSVWKSAIIIALVLIIYGLVIHLSHLDDNSLLSFLSILIFVVAIIIVCMQYSKLKNGDVTFGNVFAYGFKTSAAIALIMIVWTILMMKVIFPTMEDESLQKATETMVQREFSQEQIDSRIEITRKYFMTLAIGGTILYYAIMGAIASLLGAVIAKKNSQADNPFNQ